jgi:low affinity Fe/Cu permease
MQSLDAVYISLAISIITLTTVTVIISVVFIQILLSVKRMTHTIEHTIVIFPTVKKAIAYGVKKLKELGSNQ